MRRAHTHYMEHGEAPGCTCDDPFAPEPLYRREPWYFVVFKAVLMAVGTLLLMLWVIQGE